MSNSVRPHRWQPTKLPRPCNSPGKNTGMGCHFLLQCMKVKSESEVTQSHCRIFQAWVLEWVDTAFSEANLDTQKTPKKKKKKLSLKQTNEENAQRNEIKGQGKPLTFPCDQFGSKHKISLTYIPSVNLYQFSSVTQLCLTLCDPMDCSTPGFPVHHQLPEFTQTHVHWVGDAIQPSHPLPSPSPPTFNLSQYQGLFQWVSSSHQVAKVLEFQLQHQSFQWLFRTDFLYISQTILVKMYLTSCLKSWYIQENGQKALSF